MLQARATRLRARDRTRLYLLRDLVGERLCPEGAAIPDWPGPGPGRHDGSLPDLSESLTPLRDFAEHFVGRVGGVIDVGGAGGGEMTEDERYG